MNALPPGARAVEIRHAHAAQAQCRHKRARRAPLHPAPLRQRRHRALGLPAQRRDDQAHPARPARRQPPDRRARGGAAGSRGDPHLRRLPRLRDRGGRARAGARGLVGALLGTLPLLCRPPPPAAAAARLHRFREIRGGRDLAMDVTRLPRASRRCLPPPASPGRSSPRRCPAHRSGRAGRRGGLGRS
jgi:hypothetical protein